MANNVIRATLTTSAVAVCSSGELTHIGTYRNVVRCYPSTTDVSVRLAWRQGRDQWTTEPWVKAPFVGWWEVDLGQSKIRQALLGTQTWQWRIEAKSPVTATLDVDYHALIPSGEGYAKARKVFRHETPTSFLSQDSFGGMAAGTALNGRVAPIGGTAWASTGTAPDLVAIDGPGTTDETIGRTGASQTIRTALLSSHTDAALGVRFRQSAEGPVVRLIGRNAGSAEIELELSRIGTGPILLAQITSGGTYSVLAIGSRATTVPNVWYRLLLIGTGGALRGYLLTDQGSLLAWVFATTTVTAAGTWGFTDTNSGATAISRYFTDVQIYTPTVDAAIFASQSLEFRSHGDGPALREDATGTYWGRPPETRGGRIWLPPKGDDNRTSRIACMARRSDIENLPSDHIADGVKLSVRYRERFLAIPRQV